MEERREITWRPAFHRCTDPDGNFGIGSVMMFWTLYLDSYAVDWSVFTGWGLPEDAFHAQAPDCQHPRHQGEWPSHEPTGGAIDFHAPEPWYLDQSPATEECPRTGGRCYTEVAYILGEEVFELLCIEGDEAVWSRLREILTQSIPTLTS